MAAVNRHMQRIQTRVFTLNPGHEIQMTIKMPSWNIWAKCQINTCISGSLASGMDPVSKDAHIFGMQLAGTLECNIGNASAASA